MAYHRVIMDSHRIMPPNSINLVILQNFKEGRTVALPRLPSHQSQWPPVRILAARVKFHGLSDERAGPDAEVRHEPGRTGTLLVTHEDGRHGGMFNGTSFIFVQEPV